MSALFYGIVLQWKMDIRSKSLLITCYIVPLLFYFLMGGIFTSLMPEVKDTLIASMTVMGVSMGALIGTPPSVAEIYGSDIRNMYWVNGIPDAYGWISLTVSSFLHLLILSMIILLTAPLCFDAALPSNLPVYFLKTAVFIAVSLHVGGILGLCIKNQAKLSMGSQLLFLPSILLSGILFSSDLLPALLQKIGMLFPAYWGYRLLAASSVSGFPWFPLIGTGMGAFGLFAWLIRWKKGTNYT